MSDKTYNVLFLCNRNAARSILAEGLLNHLSQGRFKAFSAGADPADDVNPHTVTALQTLHIDTGFARAKSWDEFAGADAPEMDFIFTVCDDTVDETCPIWPGLPVSTHWSLPDPSLTRGSEAEIAQAFAQTCRLLRNRLTVFLNLPLERLDKIALKARLSDIASEAA